ncbi:uncharacterized protein [Diadema setosum]|uniref:uncharacterized protein n=1 Tax=Diadema setosum TaxID=31175 RepID=UPI003B3A8ACB
MDRERKKRLQELAPETQHVLPRSLLPHLHCLTDSFKERVSSKENNEGPTAAAWLLFEQIWKRDNWYEQLVKALREEEYHSLADKLEGPEKQSSLCVVSPMSHSQQGRHGTGFSPSPDQGAVETSRAEQQSSQLTAAKPPILEPEAKISPTSNAGSSTSNDAPGTPSMCSPAHSGLAAMSAPACQPGNGGTDFQNGSQNVPPGQNVPSSSNVTFSQNVIPGQRSSQVQENLLPGAVMTESPRAVQRLVSEPQGGNVGSGHHNPISPLDNPQASPSSLDAGKSSQVATQMHNSAPAVYDPTPAVAATKVNISAPPAAEMADNSKPNVVSDGCTRIVRLDHHTASKQLVSNPGIGSGSETSPHNSHYGGDVAESRQSSSRTGGTYLKVLTNGDIRNNLNEHVDLRKDFHETPKTSSLSKSIDVKEAQEYADYSIAQPLNAEDALPLNLTSVDLLFSASSDGGSGPMGNTGSSQENSLTGESPGSVQRSGSEPQGGDGVGARSAGSGQEKGIKGITLLSFLKNSMPSVAKGVGEYLLEQ